MKHLFLLPILLLIACGQQEITISGNPQISITADDVLQTVAEAYVFGYPLIMMDLTKKKCKHQCYRTSSLTAKSTHQSTISLSIVS